MWNFTLSPWEGRKGLTLKSVLVNLSDIFSGAVKGGVRVETSLGRKETGEEPLARDGKGLSKESESGKGRKGLTPVMLGKHHYSTWGS